MGGPLTLTDHQKREAIKRRNETRDPCRHRPQLQRQPGDDFTAHGVTTAKVAEFFTCGRS
jgi:hypothetical protein